MILDRYVLRHHVGPFLFAVITITFFFVMRVLVDFLGLFASRDLSPFTIAELFALSLGWILALTFPMAALVAVVMGFGRLAQDSELDAFHAGGVSFLRLLAPVIGASLVLTVALVYYNNVVLPEANHRLKTLTADVRKMRPTIAIREGVFMDDFDGYTLLVRRLDEDDPNVIHDVTVYVRDPRDPTRTIHAPWGELIPENGGDRLVIRLHDGEIHEVDKSDSKDYFRLAFKTHDLIFDDLGTQLERREEDLSRGDRELSAARMREITHELAGEKAAQADSLVALAGQGIDDFREQVARALATGTPRKPGSAEILSGSRTLLRKLRNGERAIDRKQRDINRYDVEIHKKYAFPVACFVFVLVGAPIGAMVRRGGAGVGGGLSFSFFLVYYMASLGGEKLGDRGIIPPAVGMWAINVALGLWGLYLVLDRDSRLPWRRRA
ncbi:MAG: LptF/LptG family permease [Gemmatimonadetes bacterium]|nr:LptF/LptG family permease [Gemmatimonadota bacterium]